MQVLQQFPLNGEPLVPTYMHAAAAAALVFLVVAVEGCCVLLTRLAKHHTGGLFWSGSSAGCGRFDSKMYCFGETIVRCGRLQIEKCTVILIDILKLVVCCV
jgi:hypothetical protein